MGRRTVIGVVYQPDSNWIGGTYYILNLVQALKTCADVDLPIVKVYCNSHKDFVEFSNITKYPYLRERLIQGHPILYKWWRRINRYLFRIELPASHLFARRTERDIFVYPTTSSSLIDKKKALAWIPDFQEEYLPEFFTQEEIKIRRKNHKHFLDAHIPVVLSSKSAQNDFHSFYPESQTLPTFVLPFAVTHPDYSAENIELLKEKFGIKGGYIFCANQFWQHKNHMLLFKSVLKAKQMGVALQLVCSGKLYDNRNPEYIEQIKNFIADNNLEDDIRILGFIERTEQLCLMKNAYAIVQPSLFEGWSTVVEDAKCINKFIFLSDILVHREQNPQNVCFFDPYNEEELTHKLLNVTPTSIPYDYSQDVRKFGESLISVINKLKND